jgi:hypothetical protein
VRESDVKANPFTSFDGLPAPLAAVPVAEVEAEGAAAAEEEGAAGAGDEREKRAVPAGLAASVEGFVPNEKFVAGAAAAGLAPAAVLVAPKPPPKVKAAPGAAAAGEPNPPAPVLTDSPAGLPPNSD